MINAACLARFFAVGCLVALLAGMAPTQTKSARGLSRNDIVIRRNLPTVYLCLDRPVDGTGVLWLRIANNTIWTIRFRAEKPGTKQRPLRLSTGNIIAGLTHRSTGFPRYVLEVTNEQSSQPQPGSDFGTASWLPSNTSALFAVGDAHSQTGSLYLEYKYEWEFTGAIADESHGPVHRVYFGLNGVNEFAAHGCPK